MFQTLPRGYDTTSGGSSSSYPFNSTSDHKWQWHYDSGQFDATGPIVITQMWVRPRGTIASFDFPSVEVVMASSPTDYSIAGNGVDPGHDTVFDNNLNADATLVRSPAPFTGQNAPGDEWLLLALDTPFSYAPTLGDDFVVQIRKCGTFQSWGQYIDGKSGSPGQNGGNRYGHISSCVISTSSFQNNEFVPLVKIQYENSDPRYRIDGMMGGQLSEFTIEFIDPFTPVTFYWGTTGPGPIDTPLGPLSVAPPVNRSFPILCDSGGVLSFSTMVPISLSGLTFYTQSAVTRDGIVTLTNPLEIPVQ